MDRFTCFVDAFLRAFLLPCVLITLLLAARDAVADDESGGLGICSHQACSVDCNAGWYPVCAGNGRCNAQQGCETACNDGCTPIHAFGICECKGTI